MLRYFKFFMHGERYILLLTASGISYATTASMDRLSADSPSSDQHDPLRSAAQVGWWSGIVTPRPRWAAQAGTGGLFAQLGCLTHRYVDTAQR